MVFMEREAFDLALSMVDGRSRGRSSSNDRGASHSGRKPPTPRVKEGWYESPVGRSRYALRPLHTVEHTPYPQTPTPVLSQKLDSSGRATLTGMSH
jgi:hypothetical protein